MLIKTQDKRKKDIYWLVGIFLISIFISVSLWSIPGFKGIASHDSSMFQYFGRLMGKGYIPYVDMFDHKGPLLFFINALGEVSIHGIKILWFLELISIYITLAFTYLAVRLFTKSYSAGLAVLLTSGIYISTLSGGNYSEEYALPLISIALYLLGRFFVKKDFRNYIPFTFGLTGVLVIFLRANMVVLWGVGAIAVISYLMTIKGTKILLKMSLFAVTGAVVATIPFIVYCLATSSLSQMVYQAFKFNALYVKFARGIGLRNVFFFFLKLLLNSGWLLIIYAQPLVLAKTWRSKSPNDKWYLVSVYSFGVLNMLSVLLSQRDYPHYLLTEIPFLIFMTAILIEELSKLSIKSCSVLTIIMIVISVWMALPTLKGISQSYAHKNTSTYWIKDTKAVAKYIKTHTTDKDTIYVHEKGANIYNLAERKANSRFFTLPAVDLEKFPKIKDEFIRDMKENKPKYIVTWGGFLKQKYYKSGTSQYKMQKIILRNYKNTYNDYYYNVYEIK